MKEVVWRVWIVIILLSLYQNVWGIQDVAYAMEQQENKVSYEYDVTGRVTKAVYLDGRAICYEYDNNGNIVSTVTKKENSQQETTPEEDGGRNGRRYKVGGYKRLDAMPLQIRFNDGSVENAQDKKAYKQFQKKKLNIKSMKVKKKGKQYYLKIQVKKIKGLGSYKELGYEIKYANNKKFKKAKTLCVKQKGITTGAEWKAKKGKKYWVKARAYMKTKTGKIIYSKYSKISKIKVK